MGAWKSCSEHEGKQAQRPVEKEEDHKPDSAHDYGSDDFADHSGQPKANPR